MDIYINNLIGSRAKPRPWLVKCSNYWLKFARVDDFREKLFVELKRSMLRNPEVILEAVSQLIEDLSIDLSDFGDELQKILGSRKRSFFEGWEGVLV
jgi:hypothetical protein